MYRVHVEHDKTPVLKITFDKGHMVKDYAAHIFNVLLATAAAAVLNFQCTVSAGGLLKAH